MTRNDAALVFGFVSLMSLMAACAWASWDFPPVFVLAVVMATLSASTALMVRRDAKTK